MAIFGLGKRGGAALFRSPTLYPAELWAHIPWDAKSSTSKADRRTPRPASPKRPRGLDHASDFYSAAFLTPHPLGLSFPASPRVPACPSRSVRPHDGRPPFLKVGQYGSGTANPEPRLHRHSRSRLSRGITATRRTPGNPRALGAKGPTQHLPRVLCAPGYRGRASETGAGVGPGGPIPASIIRRPA